MHPAARTISGKAFCAFKLSHCLSAIVAWITDTRRIRSRGRPMSPQQPRRRNKVDGAELSSPGGLPSPRRVPRAVRVLHALTIPSSGQGGARDGARLRSVGLGFVPKPCSEIADSWLQACLQRHAPRPAQHVTGFIDDRPPPARVVGRQRAMDDVGTRADHFQNRTRCLRDAELGGVTEVDRLGPRMVGALSMRRSSPWRRPPRWPPGPRPTYGCRDCP